MQIFTAALSRSIWFLTPNHLLEDTYTPTGLVAFHSNGWLGICVSDLFLQIGSISISGVFILITCYWIYILNKVGPAGPSKGFMIRNPAYSSYGPLTMFSIAVALLSTVKLAGIILFLVQVLNLEEMILYDAIVSSLVSFIVLVKMTNLSSKIKLVLESLQAINHTDSRPQMRRIMAIIVIAGFYFASLVLLEGTLTGYFLVLMKR